MAAIGTNDYEFHTKENLTLIPLEFEDYGEIPRRFHYEYENIPPTFQIGDVPEGTVSLALVMKDLDTPGENYIHWILCNIPPTSKKIGGHSNVGVHGKNSWTMTDYYGVCPLKGRHHYSFTLYALDRKVPNPEVNDAELMVEFFEEHSIELTTIIAYSDKTGDFALE